MLNLFSKFTVPGVDRVEIYQDDEDERRFYMLPGKPSFALGPDGKPMVTLIAFARDLSLMASVASELPSGETEGGLLTMQLELAVSDEDQRKIREYIKGTLLGGGRLLRPVMQDGRVHFRTARTGVEPLLSYPQWLDGSVDMSLVPEAGATFVKATEGSEKPSLTGTNLANFNVLLGQEGVRLLRESLTDGAVPGTLNYSLTFMARFPTIKLKISGNWGDVFRETKTHCTVVETKTRNGQVVKRNQYPAVNSLEEFRSYFASVKVEYDKTTLPPAAGEAAGTDPTAIYETMIKDLANGYLIAKLTTPGWTTSDQLTAKLGTDPLANLKGTEATPVGANQLWLKDWTQEMEGEFSFEIEGRVAQPMATYPNGLFYEIISPEEFGKHIIEADLNTPIFHVLDVPVRVTADFTTDPIAAIQVSVAYEEKDAKTGDVKSAAKTFTYTTGAEVFWFRTTMAKNADGSPKRNYTYSSKINYKAASAPVTTPPVTTTEQSLVIGYDRLSCVRVAVLAGAIPWEEIERVDVDLAYPGSTLPTGQQRVTLLPDGSQGSWFTYTEGNPSREYEYQLSFQLKDGPKIVTPKQKALSDRLVVDAPFSDQLEVTFVPQGTFPPVASIVLSVKYEHGTGPTAYREDDVHVFTNNTETWQWKLRLPDPTAREFQYKVDITYADGTATQGEYQPGSEGTILIGEVTSKTLEVEVVAGALDMAKWKLVVVRLSYTDPQGGVPQTETFQITPLNAAGPFLWKVGLRDPSARSYSYEIQAFGADGTTKQTVPPTSREDTLLVLEF